MVEPEPAPSAPRIDSFTASKTRTAPGEPVTLTFTTTGATKVDLTDDSGNSVQLEGEASSGTATVAPTRSAFYVLRATGAGGRDTAFVQIAVNEPLKDLFLIAVPATIASGDEGQLLWGAPGASSVTLKAGAAAAMPLTGTTGAVTVTPEFSEQYTLTAQGAPGTPPLTALATIEVRPVLKTAAITAMNAVQPGETITLSWTAAGARRVTITEMTFGQLTDVTEPASVANGTFDFVIPATLPNGVTVSDGLPLRFVVSATSGDVTVTRVLNEVVGELPVIELLDAPEFASAGASFTVAWRTQNASEITITAGGLPLFRTLPGSQARVDQGSVSLPVPGAQTEYTLLASNERGVSARRVFSVRPVPLPAITMYTLTPTIAALGDPATARWTTTGATRVQLRFENGPNLAIITTPSQVNSGNFVLTPATSGQVVLEAYNAAGDVVTDVKPVTFTGTAVSVNPTPVLRGETAVLEWTLAPAGVLEIVGLATDAPAPVPNTVNFMDLATDAMAEPLLIEDPTNGAVKLTPPAGFRFPFLGEVKPALWVSVNGAIAFADPGALVMNADFTASGNTSPSMIAPLWDDLTMGPTSSILYAIKTAISGERMLVVQWDKVQLAADANSELTFQVHLYETGQVSFIYQTLNGTLDSATVGIKAAEYPLVQQVNYNSASTAPSNGLELNFFSGGPADGTLDLTAGRSRRIEFFGRTATGLVPASAELRSFGPGDVTITEAMPFPEASVSALGQWVELKNNAAVAVDLEGLVLTSTGSVDGGFVFPAGTLVPARGFLVLGQSLDLNDTGGAEVSLVADDVPLASEDTLSVSLEGTALSTLSWDAGTPGTSIQSSQGALLLASGQSAPPCVRMATFGPAGAIGTPNAENESCDPYSVSEIPVDYRTAPMSAAVTLQQVGTTFTAADEGQAPVTLPTPFTYFGAPQTTISIAANGLMSFGAPINTTTFSNPSTPSTSVPNAVVAPFWEDLLGRSNYQVSAWRDGDRFIVSWDQFYIFLLDTTVLNFQVHLVDDGTIEFHYGALEAPSGAQSDLDRVSGSSATIWLEAPTGAFAVPWKVNTPNAVRPFSGIRFTPKP